MNPNLALQLNGKIPTEDELAAFVRGIGDKTILTSAGGYLFKSIFTGSFLHIGICPAISGGNRLHHYDIKIPDGKHLLGSISAIGEFSLLFKAAESEVQENGNLKHEYQESWRKQYVTFAATLISAGFSGTGTLDWITRKIIEESGLFSPTPTSLTDLISGT